MCSSDLGQEFFANSIFSGEKLLTTPNPDVDEDSALFKTLGLKEISLSDVGRES